MTTFFSEQGRCPRPALMALWPPCSYVQLASVHPSNASARRWLNVMCRVRTREVTRHPGVVMAELRHRGSERGQPGWEGAAVMKAPRRGWASPEEPSACPGDRSLRSCPPSRWSGSGLGLCYRSDCPCQDRTSETLHISICPIKRTNLERNMENNRNK